MDGAIRDGAVTPEQRATYERDGFLVIDPGVDEGTIDRAVARLKSLYLVEGQPHDASGDVLPQRDERRIQDAWKIVPEVKAIATSPYVLAILRDLYARKPLPFQTLNFRVGSEQKTHSDTIHFNSKPSGYMCGVWVALEDIDRDNGPVMYYPGSHAWKELTLDDVDAFEPREPARGFVGRMRDYWKAVKRNTDQDYAIYERLVQSHVDAAGAKPVYATIKKGQAFIWAANLLHGGSPTLDRARTRASQVTHYFFEGCRYYTPLLRRGRITHWRAPNWIS